jgi:pancreatic lipase-related protein 2
MYDVTDFHTLTQHSAFSSARDTVIYHYGFSQTENSDNVREIIDAYVTHGNANFILIFYDNLTTNTVANARSLGNALADAYIRLCDAGQAANRLHLIGFSLGAQIQAIASRNVQSNTRRRLTVGRLTGLDPGQIQSVLIPLTGRLSSSDAAFVDSIHTEGVGFGDHQSVGHVSYWVNGGVQQPFCTSAINTVRQTCSHNFAPTAWAESVRARAAIFPALQCGSWDDFLAGNCNSGAPTGNMGATTSTALRGTYFLRTNNNSPFSRPVAGP